MLRVPMADDASYDDAWWDSLAIDPETDTQLQAVEQLGTQEQAQAPAGGAGGAASAPPASLHVELAALRALRVQQERAIADLQLRMQAQSGEIAVVRGNWNRAKLENSDLRQAQSELESEFRRRLEQVHQDNQRQFEKLETASAFRRIEQDTRAAAWPSTVRARAESRRRYAETQLTPTKRRASPPPSSQESPLLMSRTKRLATQEPQTPTRRRAPAFPHFVNSFAKPCSSRESTPEPDTPPRPAPPRPAGVLALVRTRARWATHVLAYPYTREPPPAQVCGSAYFAAGGVLAWSDVDVRVDADRPLLVALGRLHAPQVPHVLRARLEDALHAVWEAAIRGSALAAGAAGDDALYAGAAAALRTAAGIFLRTGLVHLLANVLGWMAALAAAHPAFAAHLLARAPEAAELPTPTALPVILIDAVRLCFGGGAQLGAARVPLLVRVVRVVQVLVWTHAGGALHELRAFFQAPGVLLALFDAGLRAPALAAHAAQLLALVARDPLVLHVCLAAGFDAARQAPVLQLQHSRFPLVDMLAKLLVDPRGDAPDACVHDVYERVVQFLARAARHRDTCIVLAESAPLLAALVQCLAWDTDAVWNACGARGAAVRVSLGVRLLHRLYAPADAPARNLVEKLLSPAAQAALNGIFYTFVVAVCRVAFAGEPRAAVGARRARLAADAALAADLVDLVLAPHESDEIFELLADDEPPPSTEQGI